MRFAEMANLTWDDIDFHNRLIYIRSKEGITTKTSNAERSIPELVNSNGKGLVFLSPKGCKLLERPLLHACKKIAKVAGIKSKANIHKFRHTLATMLIHRGVSLQNIKELLGHHSVVQTEIYAHNKPDHLHKDVARLDHLLTPIKLSVINLVEPSNWVALLFYITKKLLNLFNLRFIGLII